MPMNADNDRTRCEMAVALALPPLDADRIDLMSDVHPVDRRSLRECVETFDAVWSSVRLLRRDHAHRVGELRLWLSYFPDLLELADTLRESDPIREKEALARALWERTLAAATVLRVAYSVQPFGLWQESPSSAREHSDALNARIRAWGESLGHAANASGATFVSQRFPLLCSPGALIDARSGAAARFRSDLALTTQEEGMLFGYLDARGEAFESVVSPRRFEEMTARMFEADGWSVSLTQASRDGGKDVVARRTENGREVVSYVEAKRWQGRVDLAIVKEFVATLVVDDIERGYLVTTSHVSRDAKRWATRARKLATVEFIEGPEVRRRVRDLALRTRGVFDLPRASMS